VDVFLVHSVFLLFFAAVQFVESFWLNAFCKTFVNRLAKALKRLIFVTNQYCYCYYGRPVE